MWKLPKKWFEKIVKQNEEDRKAYKEEQKSYKTRSERNNSLTDNQKDFYNDKELSLLVSEFGYLYKLQLNYSTINLNESLKQSRSTKGYDVDIITLLYLMKKIHTAYGDSKKKIPVPDWKLIVTRGLSLDEKYLSQHGNIWSNKIVTLMLQHKKPNDYDEYMKNRDPYKLMNKNSFHKYMIRARNKGLKNKFILFLGVILSEIDSFDYVEGGFPNGYKKKYLLIYKLGFENIINSLNIAKKRNNESNLEYIIRKTGIPQYSNALDYAIKHYKNELYEQFGLV